MTKSENYGELKWAWEQWRENSGKKMRGEYKKYVELINKAATLNGNQKLIHKCDDTSNLDYFNDYRQKGLR